MTNKFFTDYFAEKECVQCWIWCSYYFFVNKLYCSNDFGLCWM